MVGQQGSPDGVNWGGGTCGDVGSCQIEDEFFMREGGDTKMKGLFIINIRKDG